MVNLGICGDIFNGSFKRVEFPETLKISTYLYAICAGPFEFVESNLEGLPPMRIYAREGLLQYIVKDEMFLCTQKGMVFYKDLFGFEFPFSKYDQVFLPKHIYVAMENVGCVTFSEKRYIFDKQEASHA